MYFKTLFNLIHPFATRIAPLWIECFGVHLPGGKIDATCRLQNDAWPEGQTAIMDLAATWPVSEHGISHRQFILLDPTPLNELKSSDDLQDELQKHMRPGDAPPTKKWWQRWLGIH